MTNTDDDIAAALETCAQEPIHIPGTIQAAGTLIAYDPETYLITHAAANVTDVLKLEIDAVVGKSALDVLGRRIIHNINNARYFESFETQSHTIDVGTYGEQRCEVSAFSNGRRIIVEFEPTDEESPPAAKAMDDIAQMLDRMKDAIDEKSLMAQAVDLLRTFTGFDRVVAYRFDSDFNGEVIAEEKTVQLDPFIGLRFPHWDIPKQAREIMHKIPLRLIFDIEKAPVPLVAVESDAAPLDISIAALRGVSEIHIQYLRNIESKATMTLNLKVEGRLWGVISFHHTAARCPSPHIRRVCTSVLSFLEARLALILSKHELEIASKIEHLRDQINARFRHDATLEQIFPDLAVLCRDALSAQGIVLKTQDAFLSDGLYPDQSVTDALLELASKNEGKPLATDCLADLFGQDAHDRFDVAGAMVADLSSGQYLAAFRESKEQSVMWAGRPDKDIELAGPSPRLSPRGSFAAYKETVTGQSSKWTQLDTLLFERLGWTIFSAAQNHALSAAHKRQQEVMISELNHRVRNILALIKSVSVQARMHHASIESYRAALEQRINSLAAAHDLGTNNQRDAISVTSIIEIEAAPFTNLNSNRVYVQGDDFWIKSEQAPLFALIIHELMTNAAKYGALSSGNGLVEIRLSGEEDKTMTWIEQGGPEVRPPAEFGFGTTLIQNSIPYELGGSCTLDFRPDGVQADIWLPSSVLDKPHGLKQKSRPPIPEKAQLARIAQSLHLPVLVVEDSFMIASDLKATIRTFGVKTVELASNQKDAMAMIEKGPIGFAFLDINLGASGAQSYEIARALKAKDTGFAFVTGYGSEVALPPDLAGATIITKPAQSATLLEVLSKHIK